MLLFNVGQVTQAPQVGTRLRAGWADRLLPEPCPAAIRAVVERYLRLRLEAKFERPQTVRLTGRGSVVWSTGSERFTRRSPPWSSWTGR